MPTANNTVQTLLNEHDLARIAGLSVTSVRRLRHLRQGPKYLTLGAAVRYRAKDVLAWLSSHDVRRWTLFRGWLCACLGRLAVLAGVEALRTAVHYLLSKLG